ncbi:FadR/GntR family transcriptional regulator [Limisalsivibrio acetivorans]|uniref:FadR/GntR family transcriptional regulator n=1 Tax=Limisalsivibrio acetivorans TaxID=1304888 RepID=UPI0003B6CB9C|nr:FadR/GntR family transcriptional regulator [Limisalsivibrio acetivorans]
MKFQKIKPKRVSDEIYRQLKEMILTGELNPDEKLPSERELAVQMGVSRPSLREALQKLEAQGFLEQIQGDGTYVKSVTAPLIAPAFTELIKRDDAIFDLMEIRKHLETWSARAAAERATEEEIAQMHEYLEEMRMAKEHGEVGHISDANFHSVISYATHNVFLVHVMNNIYEWIEKVSYEVRSRLYTSPEDHNELFRQHSCIFESISRKDPDAAYDCMVEHMNYIFTKLEKIFGPRKMPKPLVKKDSII